MITPIFMGLDGVTEVALVRGAAGSLYQVTMPVPNSVCSRHVRLYTSRLDAFKAVGLKTKGLKPKH